jgi:hypothetical protein
MIKSTILFNGKMTGSPFLETKIIRWLKEGLIVEDSSFLPWSNISSVGTKDRDYLDKIASEGANKGIAEPNKKAEILECLRSVGDVIRASNEAGVRSQGGAFLKDAIKLVKEADNE